MRPFPRPHPRDDILALPPEDQLRFLGEQLSRAATMVDTRQFAQVPGELSEGRECWERTLPQQSATIRPVLEDLAHRLDVWRNTWSRLQHDVAFRLAVARELRLWSQQLAVSMAKKPPRI